jgi:alpha-beta hydrolase superfamily lysophospholipase
MGAVTALLYLPQDRDISSVVLDSPFKSLKGLVEDMAAKTTKVPGFVLSTALKIINQTLKEKVNFSLYKLNPLKLSAPKLSLPAFFIVGIEDDVIPIEHTGELF